MPFLLKIVSKKLEKALFILLAKLILHRVYFFFHRTWFNFFSYTSTKLVRKQNCLKRSFITSFIRNKFTYFKWALFYYELVSNNLYIYYYRYILIRAKGTLNYLINWWWRNKPTISARFKNSLKLSEWKSK